jgi:hypothetical protein
MLRLDRSPARLWALPILAIVFAFAFAAFHGAATAQDMGKPTRKSVKFLQPQNSDQVKSPLTVKFEAIGMETVPAGTEESGKGHHHLIIDGEAPDEGVVIPADKTHLHYGKAQTEATIELPPGKHTLTLQFADGLHRSYGPAMRATIEIEVVQ